MGKQKCFFTLSDVKKMPLGKLSKGQIAKGFEVLDDIEKVLDKKKKGNLTELSSKFYTVIPHDFGRLIPPVIKDLEALRQKMDMLLVSVLYIQSTLVMSKSLMSSFRLCKINFQVPI